VWPLDPPRLAIASAPLGGGIGRRDYVLNAQVPPGYARHDPAAHLRDLAADAGLTGDGIGFLTAAPVTAWTSGTSGGVTAVATVGLREPEWAAAPHPTAAAAPAGTVNVVAFVPVRLSDAALVNAVITLTEAKVQALVERGVPGSGTATDAAAVVTPADGPAEPFAGPRSPIGAHLARAVHAAVGAGLRPAPS
jgi:adenosylcobinamide amidohydrolase